MTDLPAPVRLADLSAADLHRLLQRAHGAFEDALPLVNAIFDDVAARGDAALREYTARFDGATLDDLAVSEAEFAPARGRADPAVRAALRRPFAMCAPSIRRISSWTPGWKSSRG